MNCKEYQRITADELAAGQTESAREVVGHRVGCVDCQQFYDEQVALFSRMDAGMRSLANEAVPTSLLVRTRRAVGEEVPRRVVPLWGYATVAMACALVLSFAYFHRRLGVQNVTSAERTVAHVSGSSAANTNVVEVQTTHPKDNFQPAKNVIHKATLAVPTAEAETPSPDLQIVVSQDERRAFAHWVTASSKQHSSLAAFTKPITDKPVQLVEIASVQLDSIDVKAIRAEDPSLK
jgi:hypothetical protein